MLWKAKASKKGTPSAKLNPAQLVQGIHGPLVNLFLLMDRHTAMHAGTDAQADRHIPVKGASRKIIVPGTTRSSPNTMKRPCKQA